MIKQIKKERTNNQMNKQINKSTKKQKKTTKNSIVELKKRRKNQNDGET